MSWRQRRLPSKRRCEPSFPRYAHQIVENAQALAEALMKQEVRMLTGGTDNHLLVMDVMKSFGLTGRHGGVAVALSAPDRQPQCYPARCQRTLVYIGSPSRNAGARRPWA